MQTMMLSFGLAGLLKISPQQDPPMPLVLVRETQGGCTIA